MSTTERLRALAERWDREREIVPRDAAAELRACAQELRAILDAAQDETADGCWSYVVPDGPKMLRESLSVAQSCIAAMNGPRRHEHMKRLQRLIDECERHRPTGPDGNHSDRHTPTCGCPAAPEGQPEGSERCHHCGSLPDADGDHSCPCPFTDSECLEHTLHPVTAPAPVPDDEAVHVVGARGIRDEIYQLTVSNPMWIDDDGNALDYLPEREALIGDFLDDVNRLVMAAVREAERAVLLDAKRSVEAMATASQYGRRRRAGLHDAAKRLERLADDHAQAIREEADDGE